MKESFDFAEHEESEGCVVTITIPSNSAVDEADAREAIQELFESTDGGDGDPSDRSEEGEGVSQGSLSPSSGSGEAPEPTPSSADSETRREEAEARRFGRGYGT